MKQIVHQNRKQAAFLPSLDGQSLKARVIASDLAESF
jgi:hypothetical protein